MRLRNWVGDVILGIPALKLLAVRTATQLQLVGKGLGAGAAGRRGLADVQHAGARGMGAACASCAAACAARRCAIDPAFDDASNALVLTTSFSSALEMRLAGLRPWGMRRRRAASCSTRSVPITYGGHALVAYWELACRFLGITQSAAARDRSVLWRPPTSRRPTRCCARTASVPGFIVICPFAGGTFEKLDKAWPEFAQFARALLAAGRQIVACPGPGEETLLREHYPGVHRRSKA